MTDSFSNGTENLPYRRLHVHFHCAQQSRNFSPSSLACHFPRTFCNKFSGPALPSKTCTLRSSKRTFQTLPSKICTLHRPTCTFLTLPSKTCILTEPTCTFPTAALIRQTAITHDTVDKPPFVTQTCGQVRCDTPELWTTPSIRPQQPAQLAVQGTSRLASVP